MLSLRPLGSTGVTASSLLRADPTPNPSPPGYAFPNDELLKAGSPRSLDRSVATRCPQSPRGVRQVPLSSSSLSDAGFILFGGLATPIGVTRPNRVHLRYGSPLRSDEAPAMAIAPTPLVGLHVFWTLYMVNSSQFTRSASFVLAHRKSRKPRNRKDLLVSVSCFSCLSW